MAPTRLLVIASLLLVTAAHISGHKNLFRRKPKHDCEEENTKVCSATDGVKKFAFPTEVADVAVGGRISGLAASRRHDGHIYAVSDVASVNVVRVLNPKGEVVGNIEITDATNVDWEDAAVGNCVSDTSKTCLYILDAGDGASPPANIIYIVQEPSVITGTQSLTIDMMIDFSGWNDDNCCTETLFVDPEANMYFFSRQPLGVDISLYKLINNGGTWETQIETTITLPSTNFGPDGADLSPSGEELLVLFPDTVYHFHVANNDVTAAVIDRASILPSVPEPQRTSIAWATDICGYYTSTEEDVPVLRFSGRTGAGAFYAPRFNFGRVVGQVTNPTPADVTGIAFSRRHRDIFYAIRPSAVGEVVMVHQASNGFLVSLIVLTSVTNNDWQDIAVGPRTLGGQSYIYILDGGEANGGPARIIFSVPEPDDIRQTQLITVDAGDIFTYDASVGTSHALTVTNSGSIFITNFKDTFEDPVTMYQLVDTGSQSLTEVEIGSFPHRSTQSGPESLDVAYDNSFFLLKNEDGVIFFPIKDNDFAEAITSVNVTFLPYVPEIDGFSVAIAPDSKSYFTVGNDESHKLKRYDAIAECPRRHLPRYRSYPRVPTRPRYPTFYKPRGPPREYEGYA